MEDERATHGEPAALAARLQPAIYHNFGGSTAGANPGWSDTEHQPGLLAPK